MGVITALMLLMKIFKIIDNFLNILWVFLYTSMLD